MGKYLGRRLLQIIPTLFIIYTIVFALTYLMPGDPVGAILGEELNRLPPEERAAIIEELGLNRPFHEQYLEFLGRMLRFDLGRSYVQREYVIDIIVDNFCAFLQYLFILFLLKCKILTSMISLALVVNYKIS